MRIPAFVMIGMLLAGRSALAQLTLDPPPPAETTPAPALPNEAEEKAWSFTASVYTYIVPHDREYAQPTFIADRGALHLEVRYNYEALNTASAWIGYNFELGKELSLTFSPMIGGVFGDTTGVAAGCKLTLSYWKLELSSEGEYVFDSGGSSRNFFYNWSELRFSPVEWFHVGLVAQRTRLYRSDLDVQRGFLVGFAYKSVDFTTYVFNPDESSPIVVLAVSASF